MNNQEFADKAEWEGGCFGLATYGLNAKELKDKTLRVLWEKYMKAFSELENINGDILAHLEDKGIDVDAMGL
jgi:hypothetical protein